MDQAVSRAYTDLERAQKLEEFWLEIAKEVLDRLTDTQVSEMALLTKHAWERRTIQWRSQDGQQRLIKDLDDDHLENIVRHLAGFAPSVQLRYKREIMWRGQKPKFTVKVKETKPGGPALLTRNESLKREPDGQQSPPSS